MRKNLAKHTAKKLPLAKRVLALCFALIFVCSCLLPAFANGTGAELETPDTEVVEAADPGAEPEPMDLYDEPVAVADEPAAVADEPEALDDDFAMDDEPAAMDDQVEKPVVDDEPAAMDDQVEKPVVDDEPAAMDNEVEKPVEGGEPPVADDTPAEEGATKTTTDASGNIVYEYDTSGTTFPDDDAAALPDGDQMQVDAAFSIPTNIYHFWLKKMSSYDLADIADAAKTAEMTVEQYLAMYGTEKGCYHIMTAADGANLKDYQFADPTSNDDPEGNSRTFAGWYYTDDLGDEQKFVFDEHLYVSESTTVEVYAKWTDEENLDGEQKQEETAPEELTVAMEDGISVNATGNLPEGAKSLSVEAVAESDEKTLSNIENALGTLSDQYGAWTIYSFDIKILDADGNELQPTDGDVTLSIQGLDLMDETRVVHVHNPVSAVAAQSAGPRRAAARRSGAEQLDATAYGDTVEFTTPNFSNFYVVSGDTRQSPHGWHDDNLVSMDINSGSTIYVAPDTKIQFEISTNDYKNIKDYTLSNQTSKDIYFSKDQTTWNASSDHQKYIIVEISETASVGATNKLSITATPKRGGGKKTFTVTIQVKSQKDVIDKTLTNADYPVTVAVLNQKLFEENNGGTAALPSEPSVQTSKYYYFDSSYNITYDSERVYNNYATSVLRNGGNDFIAKCEPSINNTNTVGIYDPIGADTKSVLNAKWSEDNFYSTLLDQLIALNQNKYNQNKFYVKDEYGTFVLLTKDNKDQYELIPYVVKLQTSTRYNSEDVSQKDRGWHIDMYVRRKDANEITLSYNANLPMGKRVNGIALPGTVQGSSPLTATVDRAQVDGKPINVNDIVTCADGTKLKFLGWEDRDGHVLSTSDNYKADKKYSPDDKITIEENTTLYGMWEELSNDLTITKNVTGLMGDHSKDFNFTVKVEQYITDADGNFMEWKDVTSDITYDGTVANGAFTLKHNDSIKLKGLSGKYKITLTENLEDTEYKTTATGYSEEKTSDREYIYFAQIGSDGIVQLNTRDDGEYNLGNTIEVVNNKTIDPDMGVLLDTLPYILILVVVVGGGVLLFLRKRKNDDDE